MVHQTFAYAPTDRIMRSQALIMLFLAEALPATASQATSVMHCGAPAARTVTAAGSTVTGSVTQHRLLTESACKQSSSMSSVCEEATPGFTSLGFETQANWLCYSTIGVPISSSLSVTPTASLTTSWNPELFDDSDKTCQYQVLSWSPSTATERRAEATSPGFCAKMGDVRANAASTPTPTPTKHANEGDSAGKEPSLALLACLAAALAM